MRALVLPALLLTACGLDPLSDGPTQTGDSGAFDPDNILMIGDLQVSPGSVDFGEVQLETSTSQTLTLLNTGSSTVSLSSAYLDGDTAYTLTTPTVPPFDIAPDESTTMVIDFTPDAEQTFTGTLNLLVSGEADFAVLELIGVGSLSGSSGDDTGGGGGSGTSSISASTNTINFDVVDIGYTASEVVTITNTGDSDVMIQDVATTASGVVEGDLETPSLLAAGDSRSFSVTFTPIAEVSTTAILTIENDSGTEPEIAVTGEGYQNCSICAPQLSVITGGSNSSSMDQFTSSFGAADSQTLSIYNNGDVDLEITDISITNDTAANSGVICGTGGTYTLTSSSSVTVPAYSSTSATVSYTFSGSGICGEVSLYPLNYENTLVIDSNDPSNPEYVITLGGNGFGL